MKKDDVFVCLSDDALLEKIEDLTRKERRITFNVVMHLGEVERRRIYLREGYASMFDYCTRSLGYSESAAYRRIKTYRCIRAFPEVAKRVQSGSLTTTTVAMIAGVMNRDNAADLLRAASGKSQREVQSIVAGYRTGKPFHDRIKPIVIERPALPLAMTARARDTNRFAPAPSAKSATTSGTELGENHLRYGGENDPAPLNATRPNERTAGVTRVPDTSANDDASRADTLQHPERETYYEFTIAADESFMRMYQRVRAIQSIKARPGEDIAATFKALMREYIARHAPEEKQARRTKRQRSKTRGAKVCDPKDRSTAKIQKDPKEARTRYIPATVKDKVQVRDQYQCTYVGRDGVRCTASRHLQFDHVRPFARGGANTPDNLRLLCAAHNRLEATAAFGPAVAGIIRESTRQYEIA